MRSKITMTITVLATLSILALTFAAVETPAFAQRICPDSEERPLVTPGGIKCSPDQSNAPGVVPPSRD
jgi:hypothetical protein